MSPVPIHAHVNIGRRLVWLLSSLVISACLVSSVAAKSPAPGQRAGYLYYEIGDLQAERPAAIQPGLMMVGGGEWPYEAFRWMAAKAGHGRIVILRASGTIEAQEEFFHDVGGITGAQTLVFQDRAAASDPEVLEIVGKADGIFIAGGDQSNYVRFWKGTPLNEAINRHVREGRPLGGTSAGLAIMGAYSYGAMDGGSLTSEQAMRDPMGPAVTLVDDFLELPLLPSGQVVTDSHFGKRDRLGRLLVFVARISAEQASARIKGIGVDENTALCIDGDQVGRVFTDTGGSAWLVVPQPTGGLESGASPGQPVMQKSLARGGALQFKGFLVTGVGAHSLLTLPDFQVQSPSFQFKANVVQGRLVVTPLD